MPDPSSAREHYQSFVRKKSTKSVKQSKVITYQPKTFENLNIFHIKPVIIEHPKIFHKLSNTIRQARTGLIALYMVIQEKVKNF